MVLVHPRVVVANVAPTGLLSVATDVAFQYDTGEGIITVSLPVIGDGSGQVKGATGAVETDDVDGTEDIDTNAHAGDEDALDEDRGWANLKGDGEEAGHWEMVPLSNQIKEALDAIVRDDDGSGAATYQWDVTFYRPGVYGAGQPATPLWHIGIEQVSAFDAVWENARDVLTRRLAQVEPDALPPTTHDFENALRRARVRAVEPEPREAPEPDED